jgi:hypothetical protein
VKTYSRIAITSAITRSRPTNHTPKPLHAPERLRPFFFKETRLQVEVLLALKDP